MNLNQSTLSTVTMNQGQSTIDQLKDIPPQQTTLTTSTSTGSRSSTSYLTIRTLSDETINEIKRMLTANQWSI